MFCIECGTENPQFAKFCWKCGRSLIQAAHPIPVEVDPVEHKHKEVQSDRARSPQETGLPVEGYEDRSQNLPRNANYDSLHNLITDEIIRDPSEMDGLKDGAQDTSEEDPQKTEIAEAPIPATASVGNVAQQIVSSAQVTYATLWERFLAYFADVIVIYLVVIGLYFLSGFLGAFGKGFLSGSNTEAKAIFMIALWCYMTLSLAIYHTTIGKYILGIEVASEQQIGAYPRFWRILVRETVGRFLSSLFFGIGYWKAFGNPKKQAWSDDIAHTVVKQRTVNPTLKNALALFVAIGLFVDIGLVSWGYQVQQHKKVHDAWEGRTCRDIA